MALGFHYAVVLPFLGALVTALAFIEGVRGSRGSRRIATIGLAILVAGWFVYMIPFATLDYSLAEVAKNANDDLPFLIRLSTAWAGGGGSLYLYTTMIALAGLYVLRRIDESPRFVAALTGVILVSFASAALNAAFDVMDGVGGLGLNPLLKSYWIIPHPLTTFGGYALLLAGSLILLYTRDLRRGMAVFLVGWSLLTLGITFGAYWSYETFGWGGYWAWDPVEVAELTVWLSATAALHSMGPLQPLRRPMLYLTASSGLLAPYVTRSGLSPLHSFAAADLGSLILLAAALVFLVFATYSLAGVILEAPPPREAARRLARAGLAGISITVAGTAIIAMAVFVYASLLAPSLLVAMGKQASIPTMRQGVEFYHPVLLPLFLVALVWLPGYFLAKELGSRGFAGYLVTTIIAAVTVVIGVDKGVLTPLPGAAEATNYQAAVGLAVSTMALSALIVSLARLALPRYRIRLVRNKALLARDVGIQVLHIGMVVTFIGVLLSGTYAFNDAFFETYRVRPGEIVEAGPVNVTVTDYQFSPHPGSVDLYSHIAGKRTTAFVAWQGLIMLRVDVAPAVEEVLWVQEEIRRNTTLAAVADLVVNWTDKWMEGNVSFTATGSIELVDINLGTSQVVAENVTINVTIVDPTLTLTLNPIVDDNGVLTGAWVDVGIAPRRLVILADMEGQDIMPGVHSYYLVNLTTPVPIEVNGTLLRLLHFSVYTTTQVNETTGVGRILEGGVELYNPYIVVLNATMTHEDVEISVPHMVGRGFYLYAVAARGEAPVLEDILDSSLTQALTNRTILALLAGDTPGMIPLPDDALSGVSLDVEFTIAASEPVRKMERIRFEANGEAIGIHGLVTPALILHKGLSDIYISVQPPMVDGYFDRYHEPLIYYLYEANRQLQPQEALALTALMASGYNIADVTRMSHAEAGAIVEQALLDLYLLAERFDPANSTLYTQGLVIMVKVVPGVNLVWAGAGIMAASAMILGILYALAARRT